jgi:ATP-binding cassette subfamily C protein
MTISGQLNTWNGLRAFAKLFATKPMLSSGVLVLTVLGMLTESLGLLLLVPLLGTLTGNGENTGISETFLRIGDWFGIQPSLTGILAIFLGLMLLRAFVRLGKDWASVKLSTALIDDLRHEALVALMQAEWRWLSAHKRSDQTNMLLTEVQRVGVGIQASLTLMATVAAIFAYWVVAIGIEPLLTTCVTVVGALLVALLAGQRRKSILLGIDQSKVNRTLHENALESFGALKMVKILGGEKDHIASFNQAVGDLRRNQVQFAVQSGRSREVFQLAGACLVAGYIFLGVSVWQIAISQLLVLVFIFARLVPMLTSAQQFLHYLLNALPSLSEAQAAIQNARDAAEPQHLNAPALISFEKTIDLQHVSVRFPLQDAPALSDITLRLPRGSKTVITGPSGSGKSTLADVLMGLLIPDHGKMLLDGIELAGVDRINWRRSVSYIPQDVVLYNGTVRDNILRGRPNASDSDVLTALQAASADFVQALPHGWNTRIGDGAQGLSGGEKQRIALARGLLRNPALLVLDEVTSALDPTNEAHIVDSVKAMSGSTTIVILGHRTGFMKIADQMIQLNAGRIVPRQDFE